MENKRNHPDKEKFERIANQCICSNLRRASRAVTNLYDEFLQPGGVLATQFIVLSALAVQSPAALTPLAEHLCMDPTTLARNLKPLERDGLVQVLPGADRRTRIVRLTPQGEEVYLKAIPLWEQAQAWMIDQVGEDRWRIMLGDWSEIVSAAHR